MVGETADVAFGTGEDGVGEGTLKIAKGRAVNMVNDVRYAGATGGHAAKDTRLAAVGVDNVRFLRAQERYQLSQREEVFQRMHGPDQFGHNGQQAGNPGGGGFQGTFRSDGRPRDQLDFEPGLLAQAVDGGQGVFLGAAHNEPGDEVGDAHGVSGRATPRGVGGR